MKTKPHLRLSNVPGTDTKLWFCVYQGLYRAGVSPESAYNKLAQAFNDEMRWAPNSLLKLANA